MLMQEPLNWNYQLLVGASWVLIAQENQKSFGFGTNSSHNTLIWTGIKVRAMVPILIGLPHLLLTQEKSSTQAFSEI